MNCVGPWHSEKGNATQHLQAFLEMHTELETFHFMELVCILGVMLILLSQRSEIVTFFFCRWLKDGQPVEEGAGHKFLLNRQKLLISQAQVSDTGRYKCVAANTAGKHEKEFDITVHGRLLKRVGSKRLPLC